MSCRATTETDVPGARVSATISRFSASVHDRRRRLTDNSSLIYRVDQRLSGHQRPHNSANTADFIRHKKAAEIGRLPWEGERAGAAVIKSNTVQWVPVK